MRNSLADADLYAKDPKSFEKYSTELQKIEASIAEAEEQWLELEMKREALATG